MFGEAVEGEPAGAEGEDEGGGEEEPEGGLAGEFPPIRTLEIPTNLPLRLTSFVGRQRELESISKLLASARLVTLTGPGGTGKTRLALRVASEVLERFGDGVFFVELAPITDPQLVPSAIGSALGGIAWLRRRRVS